MNYETKAADLWERTKAWADKNRTISGALVGGAAGTIVPGLGTTIGAMWAQCPVCPKAGMAEQFMSTGPS